MAILTGCNGGGMPAAISGNPVAGSGIVQTERANHGGSWMAPEATKGNLLYVSDIFNGTVNVYKYPDGKLVGTLTGFTRPAGMCADAAGDVWITEAAKIVEFAHGSKKSIATEGDPNEDPNDCAIDAKSGNLAVANESTSQGGNGSVTIYKNARGSGTKYAVTDMVLDFYVGYDDKSDLFVVGYARNEVPQYAELAPGSRAFTNFTLNRGIYRPAAVQWDGKYLAIGGLSNSSGNGTIYRYAVSGSSGTYVGSTLLDGENLFGPFWIGGGKVIAPSPLQGTVPIYDYPAGGSPIKTLPGPGDGTFGATVSLSK